MQLEQNQIDDPRSQGQLDIHIQSSQANNGEVGQQRQNKVSAKAIARNAQGSTELVKQLPLHDP